MESLRCMMWMIMHRWYLRILSIEGQELKVNNQDEVTAASEEKSK